jgi:hypothetical protein
MDAKYQGLPGGEDRIVYVRPVLVADLPEEIQAQAGDLQTIWSVHRPNGDRVALVADKGMAFALSRQNDMVPVSVH